MGIKTKKKKKKIRLYVQETQTETSLSAYLTSMIFMRLEITQKIQVLVHYFQSFIPVKSIQDEKVLFISPSWIGNFANRGNF